MLCFKYRTAATMQKDAGNGGPTAGRLCSLLFWLNAFMGCAGGLSICIGALTFFGPAMDTGTMTRYLIEERWPIKARSAPIWVGEWSGGMPPWDSVEEAYFEEFVKGYLKEGDLDWGYWPINGDQINPLVDERHFQYDALQAAWSADESRNLTEVPPGYLDKLNGVLERDYATVRSPVFMAALQDIMGPAPSLDLKVPLSTSGPHIVGTDGERIKLSCVNWYGAQQQKWAVGGLNAQPLRNLTEKIAELGFNCVRLVYSVELALENPNVTAPEFAQHNPDLIGRPALEVLDRTVAELSRVGVMTILNNHNSEAGWCCHISKEDGVWATTRYPLEMWLESMEVLAWRYKDDPFVVGMDLRNEIHDVASHDRIITWGAPGRNASTDWKYAVEEAARRLHAVAPEWLMIVSGLCFSFDVTRLDPKMGLGGTLPDLPRMDKLVWTTHFYPMSMWWRYFERVLIKNTPIFHAGFAGVGAVWLVIAIVATLRMRPGALRGTATARTAPTPDLSPHSTHRKLGLIWLSTAFEVLAALHSVAHTAFDFRVLVVNLCLQVGGTFLMGLACASSVGVVFRESSRCERLTAVGVTFAVWISVAGAILIVLAQIFLIAYTEVGCEAVFWENYVFHQTCYAFLTLAAVALIASCACWLSTRGTARRPMRTPSAGGARDEKPREMCDFVAVTSHQAHDQAEAEN